MRALVPLLCFILTLPTAGCAGPRFGWEREGAQRVEENAGEDIPGVDGPTAGHFDEDGNWIPDNEDIPFTYKIPDISAGFIFDINSLDLSPCLQIELLEYDTDIPYIQTLKLDGGVAYQRAYAYIGKLWTNIFEISTGGFVGWNWEDNELSYGIGITIIKF